MTEDMQSAPEDHGVYETPLIRGWEVIDAITLGDAGPGFSFTDLDPAIREWRLMLSLIKDDEPGEVLLRFNGDDGLRYYQRDQAAVAATTTSVARVTDRHLSLAVGNAVTSIRSILAKQGTLLSDILISKPMPGVLASVLAQSVSPGYPEVHGSPAQNRLAGHWLNTSDLIERIDVTCERGGGFAAGSRAVLEGLVV